MPPGSDLQDLLASLAAVAPAVGAKRGRCGGTAEEEHGRMVSDRLTLLSPYDRAELLPAARQRAQAEARSVVRSVDKLLEKILDVRIITTWEETDAGRAPHNHVIFRVLNEFQTMISHERGLAGDKEVLFCFMASSELEPVVTLVVVDSDAGRLVRLTRAHFELLETVLREFRVRFGLAGESYSYTPLERRLGCSWHSRHFHLKIRIPTEMYLRAFPAMQVLGGNLACRRSLLEPFKDMWEPVQFKFQLKQHQPWAIVRADVLADLE
jgi:hypothetical protein